MDSSESTPSRSAFILAFATIYLVWGSTYLAIRVAVETMQPFFMAAVRFLIAGFALYLFLRLRGAPKATPRQWFDNALVGTCLLLGGNGVMCLAEQTVPSGVTALVIGITPLFMVFTEWAWPGGQRPTATTFFGLVLGVAGVAWLAAPWETAARVGVPLRGLGLVLLGCFLWAVGSIYSRHVRKPAPLMLGSSMQMVTGGAALLVAAGLHGEFAHLQLGAVSARGWLAVAYLISVGSLVGFSTFVWLMKHSTPARVSTYAYVNPIVAVFLGWLILHEPISLRMLFAAVLIIGAVVIITLQKTKKKTAPGAPALLASVVPAEARRS